MGEFGAHKPSFPSITTAAYTVRDLQIQSCNYNFNGINKKIFFKKRVIHYLIGWAFWTYDTTEQPEFYNILDSSGAINGQLAPIARPNPCIV